jgi:two-component system, chemotaxis family, protein-glutamate methylesterase/glutaminase
MPAFHPLNRKIKVLIVDDSAIVRRILADTISAQPDMEVVGTAPDAYVARDKLRALVPDVLTLDIEMPGMNGLAFLKQLMRENPVPTIIISSLGQASCAATLEALRYGAVDLLAKPSGPYSVGELRESLALRIRGAAGARPRSPDVPPSAVHPMQTSSSALALAIDPQTIIAIGASTGGTVAIQEILLELPADMPPMVVTQHIPAGFSRAFAKRLDKLCCMEIREAVDGDLLRRGLVLVAPGDYHMLVRCTGAGYAIELQQGSPVNYQRPSVDVTFASTARSAGNRAVGVLLTGMGADGAAGMLALKREGAITIAQDEASCVVYGMPREARRLNAVSRVAALSDIAGVLKRIAIAHGYEKRRTA